MTAKEIIKVVQAFDNGKQIQSKFQNDKEWKDATNPIWDFSEKDYRVKPEQKLTPYALAEEFMDGQTKHGPNIKVIWEDQKDFLCYANPIRITDNYVEFALFDFGDESIPRAITYDQLLEGYDNLLFYWQDGTPCGIVENNS